MEKFIKVDKQKIKEALNSIEELIKYVNGNDSVYILDGAEETLLKVLELFEEREEYELNVPERELENVDNFNQDTLLQIQKYFKNPFTCVFGHGTLQQAQAQGIVEEGLKMKVPDILASAVPLEYNENTFETVKNWPHLKSKFIVLIGLQDTSFIIPCLKKHTKENEYDYDYGYLMNRDRIIGYIDVENEKFIPSPYYVENQVYNDGYDVLTDNRLSEIKGYSSLYNLLYFVLHSLEMGNFLEVDDQKKFEGVRENVFVSAYARAMDNIKYIKEKLKNEGIIMEEYEASSKFSTIMSDDELIPLSNDYDFEEWDLWVEDDDLESGNKIGRKK